MVEPRHGMFCPPRLKTVDALKDTLRRSLELAPAAVFVQHDWKTWQPDAEFDVCFLDVEHTIEDTYLGVQKMAALLKPGILVLDDYFGEWFHPDVACGAMSGLLGREVVWSMSMSRSRGWHNGIGVFVVDSR